jgi:hypothetical protein
LITYINILDTKVIVITKIVDIYDIDELALMSNTIKDNVHSQLNKLRIISKIKEGQKLDTANGLHIYTDGWINWLSRKWYRDNKDEGIRFLLDLYKSFGQSVETIINESKLTYKNANLSIITREYLYSRQVYGMITAAVELKSSIKGIDCLTKTYAGFPATTASLEGIVRDYIVVIYSLLLDAIPDDKKPKDLLEDIIYDGQTVFRGNEQLNIDLSIEKTTKVDNVINDLINELK